MFKNEGFFIAVESFEQDSPPLRMFAEHLASNTGAYLALKGLPPIPISLLIGHEEGDEVDGVERSGFFDDSSEVLFDPIEAFVEPRERVTKELAQGRIVIADRFLHHVDRVIPHAHLSLPVERLLFTGDTQADCVVFLERPGHLPLSEFAEHATAAFKDMAARRNNVHTVVLEEEHVRTCDAIWRQVKPSLRPWLKRRFPGAESLATL